MELPCTTMACVQCIIDWLTASAVHAVPQKTLLVPAAIKPVIPLES